MCKAPDALEAVKLEESDPSTLEAMKQTNKRKTKKRKKGSSRHQVTR